MASYQDVDIRLKVIEDKVAFIMKAAAVAVQIGSPLSPEGHRVVQVPMDQFYAELQRAGGMLIDVKASDQEVSGDQPTSEGVGNDQVQFSSTSTAGSQSGTVDPSGPSSSGESILTLV